MSKLYAKLYYRKKENNADKFTYSLHRVLRILMRKFDCFLMFFIFLAGKNAREQTVFIWRGGGINAGTDTLGVIRMVLNYGGITISCQMKLRVKCKGLKIE